VTGTHNDWGFDLMAPDGPGIFKRSILLDFQYTEFQIALDADRKNKFYPQVSEADSGEGIILGPDGEGEDLRWILQNPGFAVAAEIILDFNQEDRRRMVTWRFTEYGAIEG